MTDIEVQDNNIEGQIRKLKESCKQIDDVCNDVNPVNATNVFTKKLAINLTASFSLSFSLISVKTWHNRAEAIARQNGTRREDKSARACYQLEPGASHRSVSQNKQNVTDINKAFTLFALLFVGLSCLTGVPWSACIPPETLLKSFIHRYVIDENNYRMRNKVWSLFDGFSQLSD